MAGLSKENPFKDVFNKRVITAFAERLHAVDQSFRKDAFVTDCMISLENLGFLERSHHIRDVLKVYLPKDYGQAVEHLIASLGPVLENPGTTDWESFIVMPQTAYVSKYGKDDYDLSMKALYEMTQRFSAENDLRTYLELNYSKTMSILLEWTKDPSPHVRRLVSEGTRPRLPLAGRIKRFQEDPTPIIELLNELVEDESLYVRRSVANSINDIAKDNPTIAIDTLEKWSEIDNEHVQWLVRHASRSLVKQGDTRVLKLLGYNPLAAVDIKQFSIKDNAYEIGQTVEFTVLIENNSDIEEALMIDYVIHYVKANDQIKEKVFKMRKTTLKAHRSLSFTKKHHLKNTSGRKHYPGIHCVELIVNGERYKEIAFELTQTLES